MPGMNQLYINNEWRTLEPYIYHNGVWRQAFTNIYHNGQWNELGEIFWTLWSPTDSVEWVSQRFNSMAGGPNEIEVSATTEIKNDCLYFYHTNERDDVWRGNNWSTKNPVYIPKEANTLKLTFNKDANATSYARVNVGLILPSAESSFDSVLGASYTSSLSGTNTYTLSLTLDETVKGSGKYVVVVNGWMRSDSGTTWPGALYIQKVWFE